jgi:hypothetical protein
MKKFSVTYKGNNYEVNAGLRATFFFEKIAEKALKIETTQDVVIYAFSIMWTAVDFSEEWNDFVEYCDEHPDFIPSLFDKIPKLPVEGNAEAPKEKIRKGPTVPPARLAQLG